MPGPAFEPDLLAAVRNIGAATFDFSRQVAVMAIVNRTPDSFHDRGATFELEQAVQAALAYGEDGADWVDIGGMPWGLAGRSVTEAEEIDRVVPLVAALRAESDVVISADTFRPEVARLAIEAGADVINDVSGLHYPEVADLVAETGTTLVITHSLLFPLLTPPARGSYGDVTVEVVDFLRGKVDLALERGVKPDQLIVDPGHDLNKSVYHSIELTRRLDEIAALGHPTLVAVSNKHFIGDTLDVEQHDRKEGTLAALAMCILQGARIVRVHDVKATVAAVRMTEALLGWRQPANPRHNV